MEVFEAIKRRRTVRKFNPARRVTDEQVEKLLQAAQWASSAGNLQSRFFVVVRDQGVKRQLVEAAWGQSFIATAPVVIVLCADLDRSASKYGSRGRELYAIQDTTLAAQNLWLAATEMGLAAGWVGAFDEGEVSRILDLGNGLRPIAIMPLGYPAESPSPPPRRWLKEISKQL
ncbi:nitroreductase [candidate division WWE3 bacterium CG09_land_8_20_14_0_10_47_33]|uniref:Nitroreductase n=1 Tax=candidate division WWE3 bacterium CG_4_9_14_0_2_um_filter_48_10 TaxID=1975078 RepID=A0A2M8EHP7_UNCKA|nr:MAG: nitroreductase [candidate division WWE3 bacterium CG09_land_8_20_14_0_10_47_33]PIZ40523.1 MAG: nitroreductase [candidate division WWE3 bacterium CG_4_10_14_0_2_um_filter_47_8]PJC21723.1 MAG: nitroreductase [candidate division WWE3 bacterium CG_4_9_14_0_2_um_filter_48_10]PJE50873.1 MAG: nitroreductase [candidate division WWE3 bacterium CG10_big_fil_rev_8_21_14_0_10_48_23]